MKKSQKIAYVFNLIAIAILIGAFSLFYLFEKTSNHITTNNLQSNINYIENITSNISELIKSSTSNDIYNALNNNKELRKSLEQNLQFLVTDRYKYIYVVNKESNSSKELKFLLDGAKSSEEKSEFGEYYSPLNFDMWNSVYKTKKPFYFQHKTIKSIWMTYLRPIVIDEKVEAIIVIDFSLKDHEHIVISLQELNKSFKITIIFFIFIFFVIIIFSYIDKRRINEIEDKSQEILEFNSTLQLKVADEVEKNRQKDQHIIQQSRLAQMGEMISMIAHQWRQPLASISAASGNIGLKARLDKLDNEMAISLSDNISDNSQHLSTTINDFREFFKSNKDKKDVTYEKLIESVLAILEASLRNKNIVLVQNLNSDMIFNTYPNEIKQVILNLIKNAEDILLENKIENATITISTNENSLSISDNGRGVPEDIIDKVFNPYFSTKVEKNGTGLGLYMSKTIIEEHCGGEISVVNDSSGAVFTIKLDNNC